MIGNNRRKAKENPIKMSSKEAPTSKEVSEGGDPMTQEEDQVEVLSEGDVTLVVKWATPISNVQRRVPQVLKVENEEPIWLKRKTVKV